MLTRNDDRRSLALTPPSTDGLTLTERTDDRPLLCCVFLMYSIQAIIAVVIVHPASVACAVLPNDAWRVWSAAVTARPSTCTQYERRSRERPISKRIAAAAGHRRSDGRTDGRASGTVTEERKREDDVMSAGLFDAYRIRRHWLLPLEGLVVMWKVKTFHVYLWRNSLKQLIFTRFMFHCFYVAPCSFQGLFNRCWLYCLFQLTDAENWCTQWRL